MKKTLLLVIIITLYASFGSAQLTSKVVYNKQESLLELTIINLHSDTVILLKTDIGHVFLKYPYKEYIKRRRIDKKLYLNLDYYDGNKLMKQEFRYISDINLEEKKLAPQDSIIYTVGLRPEENYYPSNVNVNFSFYYTTVSKNIFNGHYQSPKQINLGESDKREESDLKTEMQSTDN